VARQLRPWLSHEDLNGVRDPSALARLPVAERKQWEALWAEVKSLCDKAAVK
jgi:hypothetical protein